MKTIKLIIFALSVLVCASQVHAASWNDATGIGNSGNSIFSMQGAQFTVIPSVRSNTHYVVTSDSAAGAASFDSILIRPDDTAGKLEGWTATNTFLVASNGSAGDSNVWLVASNTTGGTYTALATNDVLVYRGANDVYQMVVLCGSATGSQGVITSNALGQVQIKLWNNLTNAPVAGDKIYKMVPRLSLIPFTLQNVTNDVAAPWSQYWFLATRASPFTFVGEIGEPAMLSMSLSNGLYAGTNGIFVSGRYVRR